MAAASGNVAADGCEGYKNAWHAANKQLDASVAKCKELAEEVKTLTASVAGMAAAKDDPVSVEDNDSIEALLDSADGLSSTISRPFSGLSTVLARIRAASIAQKKELHATLEVVKALTEVCQQRHATLEMVKEALKARQEALKADAPKQIVSVKKEPTEVGDPPRLASHAGYPAKRSRPSPSASSGAEICRLTKCLKSQCLHCRPLSGE